MCSERKPKEMSTLHHSCEFDLNQLCSLFVPSIQLTNCTVSCKLASKVYTHCAYHLGNPQLLTDIWSLYEFWSMSLCFCFLSSLYMYEANDKISSSEAFWPHMPIIRTYYVYVSSCVLAEHTVKLTNSISDLWRLVCYFGNEMCKLRFDAIKMCELSWLTAETDLRLFERM